MISFISCYPCFTRVFYS